MNHLDKLIICWFRYSKSKSLIKVPTTTVQRIHLSVDSILTLNKTTNFYGFSSIFSLLQPSRLFLVAVLVYDLLTHPWRTHAIGFGVEFYDSENERIVSSYPDGPFRVLTVSAPQHLLSLLKKVHIGGSLCSRSGLAFWSPLKPLLNRRSRRCFRFMLA